MVRWVSVCCGEGGERMCKFLVGGDGGRWSQMWSASGGEEGGVPVCSKIGKSSQGKAQFKKKGRTPAAAAEEV